MQSKRITFRPDGKENLSRCSQRERKREYVCKGWLWPLLLLLLFPFRSCLCLFQFEFPIIRGLVWVFAPTETEQTKNERREMFKSWRLPHSNSSPLGKHLYLPSIVRRASVCVCVCVGKHSLIFTHTHGGDAHLNASLVSLNTWTMCTEVKSETASVQNCNSILKRAEESKTRLCS